MNKTIRWGFTVAGVWNLLLAGLDIWAYSNNQAPAFPLAEHLAIGVVFLGFAQLNKLKAGA